ncbi:N-carbamoylputrescine amidase [Candidatus Persebacteraceae bacterium Df01]|jgi:N-carbamoylputrescine amidase|uniref:N-carbamoylputrescine amidase n=1 Tax=Candidatus Doriopsillibacter californiensis TaxID=2970740 RepID=A0ABT7QMV7_9GAMM|nr:N-carbamoylputrescine amidase [Candidatus Persebacteraceae bacterium Df01]
MTTITVAAIQAELGDTPAGNLARMESLARQAAGAHIILLPELIEYPYFCKTQRAELMHYATTVTENRAVTAMQLLAAELRAVIPVSFYEKAGQALFNSLAIIDADGTLLGVYRKSHIPDGPGYQEKFYFAPGDTGFRVWHTQHGVVGAGVCWDQWFPEAARAMALQGAEILLYPTAIGSEPQLPDLHSAAHWRTVMCGHAAANMMPLAAANRIGCERQNDTFGHSVEVAFYGHSFIADECGSVCADAGKTEAVITAEVDLAAIADKRQQWGIFRDRRPDLYGALLTRDGSS